MPPNTAAGITEHIDGLKVGSFMFTYDMIAEDIQAGKEALKLVHTLQEELAKLKKSVQILTSDLDEEVSDDDELFK